MMAVRKLVPTRDCRMLLMPSFHMIHDPSDPEFT